MKNLTVTDDLEYDGKMLKQGDFITCNERDAEILVCLQKARYNVGYDTRDMQADKRFDYKTRDLRKEKVRKQKRDKQKSRFTDEVK